MSDYEPKIHDRVRVSLEGVVRKHHAGGLCIEVLSDDREPRRVCFSLADRLVEHVEPDWKPGDVAKAGDNTPLFRVPNGWVNTTGAHLYDSEVWRPLTPVVLDGEVVR